MFMPPPPRRRSGAGRFFTVVLILLLGFSLVLNIFLLARSAAGGAGSAKETSVVEGDSAQRVAVVALDGVIMDAASQKFDRLITSVEKDGNVKALVIEIDSPGGSVTASDEMYHRLQKFKQTKPGVPVIVSMGGLAASGGYYVACGADYLVAQPSTLTGNIGVLMPRYNISELMSKYGVKETTIVSSGATFKNAGSMFQPENPEDNKYIQDLADKAFTQFKDVVAKGRSGKLKKPLDQIANGKIYLAADALALGLIDQVGYRQDAYAYAATKAGLSKPSVVKYQDQPSFMELLTARSTLPAPSAAAQGVTMNGINLDAGGISELMTPRMMYLWRGQ
jgi:protease-4